MSKSKRRFVSTAAAALITLLVMAIQVGAAQTVDSRCYDLMAALRSGDYAAAIAHFDPAMQVAFSAERIGSMWQSLTAAHGRLVGWKITGRSSQSCNETIVAPLQFARASNVAAFISVNPNGEVSGLYFAPLLAAPTPAPSPSSFVNKEFNSIDVIVGRAPVELCGTLTVPATGSGPWPGLVLISWADKDGTIGPNRIFKDIAEGLSSRGIVVLRYDKRSYDPFEKKRGHLTVQDYYIDDGAAAVNLLRSRSEVAKDRVLVAGNSITAAIAPEVAREAAPVQGLILLAPPPGKDMGASAVRQIRFLGAPPRDVHQFERKARELDSHRMPPTETFGDEPASYYYDLVGRNVVATARQLDVPILILLGTRDYQVVDRDIAHWQEGLRGTPHVRVVNIPKLNHLLLAGSGRPSDREYYDPGHVDQRVIDAMAGFIENPLAH